jgi:diguanylate cyclase (GGDEF)-like protein
LILSIVPAVILATGTGMGILDRLLGEFDSAHALMHRSGRIVGLLYFVGGAAAIPAILVIAPEDRILYALPLLGLVPSLFFLRAPWQRFPTWVLHVPIAGGTAIICLVVCVLDLAFTAYYAFVAVFVAITFPRWQPIVGHLSLISAAMVVPVFVGQGTGQAALVTAMVSAPSLLLVAGIVGWLTARLEGSRADYLALSRRDELTGVGNYRALHERLAEEISRHGRAGRRFALVLVDLDEFKEVNELHGHLEGDRALAAVGEVLREGVRGGDVVFRQGGDEFSVLAPETSPEEAEELAARLCIRVGAIAGVDPPLSACTGVAIFPDDGTTGSDLLGIADVRLFAAKREFRAASPDEGT